MISREITSAIGWCLDNLCPPIIRDFRPFMKFIIKFAYGDKTDMLMDFKDKLPFLSEDEIAAYYSAMKNVPIAKRPVDLSKKSINFILNNLVGTSILDISCGRGYLTNKISENESLDVMGIDIVRPPSLKPNINFSEGSITCIPLSDNSYDTVISSHTLEHVVESRKALSELKRVAKKRIIIVVPRQREYKYTPALHVNFYPYLYSLQRFINDPNAKYELFGNDFICVIDK